MKYLSAPAMYDLEYINQIAEMNKIYRDVKVSEVYGSIESSPIGTIRPSDTLDQLDIENLRIYIEYCSAHNIQFDYIMNSTVLDGSEYTNDGRKKIVDFVQKLIFIGISSITVAIPYLIRLIRYHFPDLHITASICSEIDSVKKAQEFESFGVNRIVLAKDANRDFKLLENIRKHTNIDIKVLATTPCTYKCGDIFYHMNLSSAKDNNLFKGDKNVASHTTISCQMYRLQNMEEYLKSPWIRPEDMAVYTNIGINMFKLDGRDKPMEYNLEVLDAYMKQEYNGNLLYLMQNYFPKDKAEIKKIGDNDFWRLSLFLDNKKLDGFIEGFSAKKVDCSNGCDACQYCRMWQRKALTYDKTNVDGYLTLLKEETVKRLTF